MTAVLVFTQGPLTGQRLEPEGELVIGREGAAVTIEDSELSRRHAAVRPVEGGIEIEDLGSLNGTFVNGQRITAPTRLAGGDSVKLGQSVLELEGASRARDGHVSRSNPGRPRRKLPHRLRRACRRNRSARTRRPRAWAAAAASRAASSCRCWPRGRLWPGPPSRWRSTSRTTEPA